MTVLPSVQGKDLVAALKKAGFEIVRVKGSHQAGQALAEARGERLAR